MPAAHADAAKALLYNVTSSLEISIPPAAGFFVLGRGRPSFNAEDAEPQRKGGKCFRGV